MGDHLISPPLTILLAPALMWSVFGPGAIGAVVFFVVLGIYQLVCIGVVLKSKSPFLLAAGIPGNLVSIVIYFVSFSGVAMFGVPPQNGGIFALLIKALEAIFVLASIYVLGKAPSKLSKLSVREGRRDSRSQ
jgi:hypothetical protein